MLTFEIGRVHINLHVYLICKNQEMLIGALSFHYHKGSIRAESATESVEESNCAGSSLVLLLPPDSHPVCSLSDGSCLTPVDNAFMTY